MKLTAREFVHWIFAIAIGTAMLPGLASAQPPIQRIRPQPVPPDLIVQSLVLLGVPTTSACGTPLPQVGCPNGFQAQVTIRNNGGTAVPADTTHVRWTVNFGTTQWNDVQTIGQAIPAFTSITVTRPYYFGPCGCAGPPRIITFTAFVDPNNTVTELNEGNNALNPPVQACNVCSTGP